MDDKSANIAAHFDKIKNELSPTLNFHTNPEVKSLYTNATPVYSSQSNHANSVHKAMLSSSSNLSNHSVDAINKEASPRIMSQYSTFNGHVQGIKVPTTTNNENLNSRKTNQGPMSNAYINSNFSVLPKDKNVSSSNIGTLQYPDSMNSSEISSSTAKDHSHEHNVYTSSNGNMKISPKVPSQITGVPATTYFSHVNTQAFVPHSSAASFNSISTVSNHSMKSGGVNSSIEYSNSISSQPSPGYLNPTGTLPISLSNNPSSSLAVNSNGSQHEMKRVESAAVAKVPETRSQFVSPSIMSASSSINSSPLIKTSVPLPLQTSPNINLGIMPSQKPPGSLVNHSPIPVGIETNKIVPIRPPVVLSRPPTSLRQSPNLIRSPAPFSGPPTRLSGPPLVSPGASSNMIGANSLNPAGPSPTVGPPRLGGPTLSSCPPPYAGGPAVSFSPVSSTGIPPVSIGVPLSIGGFSTSSNNIRHSTLSSGHSTQMPSSMNSFGPPPAMISSPHTSSSRLIASHHTSVRPPPINPMTSNYRAIPPAPYPSSGPPISSNMITIAPPPINSFKPSGPPLSMAVLSSPMVPPPTLNNSGTLNPPPTKINSSKPLTATDLPRGPPNINSKHQQPYSPNLLNQVSQQLGGLSVAKEGWNRGWGTTASDLLQQKYVIPPQGVVPPKPVLAQEYLPNCSPDIFRCTITKVPETQSILQKSRLPFGILIHPFKDLDHLAVVSCNTIVRCRGCRTYINPFVVFKGERRWECNLCYRVNEIPDEFLFDPVSRTYGDPSRRPEVKESTLEFIAPQEYMLRPPQPATYLYVLDVSRQAVETGYLQVVCETILSLIDKIPGDRRTMIGFITFSTTLQFYVMGEGQKSVQMLEIGEVDDVFIPSPQDLLVNVEECRDLIEEFLITLPDTHSNTHHTQTALGAAVTAAYKLIGPIGGRISVMVCTLPTVGPGALKPREDPNQRSAKDISNLGPATDFYKKLALDCSGQQVAVDLFALNSQFVDIATLSGMSKFSGGCIYHFPGFHVQKNPASVDQFRYCLIRYITRKIGFESVMRIRATRGIAITHFHGNFFVRSTDLLSLPNINPDAGFGMQVAIEEPLHNIRQACFQAALLYTSSKGERRIRVHTLCLPVTPNVHEIVVSADQQAIIGLLSKMAVDRCLSSQMTDAREAIVNACADILGAYRATSGSGYGLAAPLTLNMLPLYILALLKSIALRHSVSTKLDDRVFAMCEMKTLPLSSLILSIYPDLFPIHNLTEKGAIDIEDTVIPQPGRLHLSAEYIDRNGAYLMDAGSVIYVYIRSGISTEWVDDVIGVPSFAAIPQPLYEDPLPVLDNNISELTRNFVMYLQKNKPYQVPIYVIREDNPSRALFINLLIDDRSEGAHSYMEFLQFIKSQVK